ncbi:unnamed protein product, partial [Prorocentrum cordatum]
GGGGGREGRGGGRGRGRRGKSRPRGGEQLLSPAGGAGGESQSRRRAPRREGPRGRGPGLEEEMRKRSAEHATQRAQPSAHRVRALKPLGASSCTFLAAAGAQLPQPQAAVDLVHKKGRRRDSLEFQKVILRPVSVAPRHPTPRLL